LPIFWLNQSATVKPNYKPNNKPDFKPNDKPNNNPAESIGDEAETDVPEIIGDRTPNVVASNQADEFRNPVEDSPCTESNSVRPPVQSNSVRYTIAFMCVLLNVLEHL